MAPKPPVIGAAAPDAQAAGGVCYVYWQGKVDSGAVPDPFPPEGVRRKRSAQVIPGRSRFGSFLLVDHRLSSLCHFATNEPSANVYLDGETTPYTIHLRITNYGKIPTGEPYGRYAISFFLPG